MEGKVIGKGGFVFQENHLRLFHAGEDEFLSHELSGSDDCLEIKLAGPCFLLGKADGVVVVVHNGGVVGPKGSVGSVEHLASVCRFVVVFKEDYARGVGNVPYVNILEGCKVATAKTLHVIIGGYANNGGEVVVGVGRERGDFLGKIHDRHGSKGSQSSACCC